MKERFSIQISAKGANGGKRENADECVENEGYFGGRHFVGRRVGWVDFYFRKKKENSASTVSKSAPLGQIENVKKKMTNTHTDDIFSFFFLLMKPNCQLAGVTCNLSTQTHTHHRDKIRDWEIF